MSETDTFASRLQQELRHRVRLMPGRDPQERDRSATPLELLYDLTYVVAFATASDLLAEQLGHGIVGPAIGAFAFAVWAVSWAWLNYTWFASAYGNDDVVLRLATIVQMIGVIVLIYGLPASFEAAAGTCSRVSRDAADSTTTKVAARPSSSSSTATAVGSARSRARVVTSPESPPSGS